MIPGPEPTCPNGCDAPYGVRCSACNSDNRVSEVDMRWQMVTCTKCSRHYQCTPLDDIYDGLCTRCLLRGTA